MGREHRGGEANPRISRQRLAQRAALGAEQEPGPEATETISDQANGLNDVGFSACTVSGTKRRFCPISSAGLPRVCIPDDLRIAVAGTRACA